jgi:serine/threonine-protein kinase
MGGVMAAAFSGPTQAFAIIGAGLTLMPLGYLVSAARTLARSGFRHADLDAAFRAEAEAAREERISANGLPSLRAEAVLRSASRISGLFAAASSGIIVAMASSTSWWSLIGAGLANDLALTVAGVSIPLLGLSFTMLHFRMQRSRDVDTEFWKKVWQSRVGRMLFRVGERLAGTKRSAGAMTHRATELSLGMAAEQLFAQLPKESRDALGDLPDVLRRLQDDAKLLRARHDELADALSSASDADASSEYEEIRALRDEAKLKQSQTIAALETIRLGLLKMHAGATTVASLSTHLGAAADVAADVERLLEARAEVDRALRFPREIATTPA